MNIIYQPKLSPARTYQKRVSEQRYTVDRNNNTCRFVEKVKTAIATSVASRDSSSD